MHKHNRHDGFCDSWADASNLSSLIALNSEYTDLLVCIAKIFCVMSMRQIKLVRMRIYEAREIITFLPTVLGSLPLRMALPSS